MNSQIQKAKEFRFYALCRLQHLFMAEFFLQNSGSHVGDAGDPQNPHAAMPRYNCFRDLRHTFATLALQNGVDIKTVCAVLGYYDVGFTLRTYTHTTRQKQDEAAQAMGNLLAQVR